jgi:nickel/cobalt transporter (NicO) family protein
MIVVCPTNPRLAAAVSRSDRAARHKNFPGGIPRRAIVNQELLMLCLAAVTIALLHTICGPDHYVPFVAMSRAGHWSLRKTVIVTLLCGAGHVGSSVVLGLVGIALGIVLTHLEIIEQVRGNVAGWLLIGFGLAYLAWGVVQSCRGRPHTHRHVHADGTIHSHKHTHRSLLASRADHIHLHEPSEADPAPGAAHHAGHPARITPWVLFTIFIFGPCEPLIPLLMYPAARSSWWGVAFVTVLFSVATIGTMLVVVVALVHGIKAVHFRFLHPYSHAMAGLVILICGLAINFGL